MMSHYLNLYQFSCYVIHTDVKFEGQTVYLTCPVQNFPKLGVVSSFFTENVGLFTVVQ